jgi:alpha-amylase
MASGANRHENEHGHGYTMLQGFEWYTPGGGTHWDWLAQNAERFADMGITAIWLPPPCKTASSDSTGYDIYDLWDLGQYTHPRDKDNQQPGNRTKYGTREQLEACMKALREHGIAVYIDAVLNHKMGADEKQTFKVSKVDWDDRTKVVSQEPYDIEGWTSFTFPGRIAEGTDTPSKFQWSFEHFTGVDWDDKGKDKAIFQIEGQNKDWAKDVDKENANYDFLMGADIDHAHPDVRNEVLSWGAWMVKSFPISGFRFDAVKHISREFVHDFVKHVRQAAREKRKDQGREAADESFGPITFSVGEFWKDSLDSCLNYLGKFGDEQFSLFDAPLHYNFKEAGDGGADYDLRKVFDGTIVQARPIDAVTLVENHDTQRGQALESSVSPQFKPLAYALILLRQDGYPCVFLGDLDGCRGGVEGEKEDGSAVVVEAVSNLDKIIKSRKCFAHGDQHDYFDHPQCVGWTRDGVDGKDGCAVVMCNGNDEGRKRMNVGEANKGTTWVDALGWREDEIKVGDDGWAEFVCHAHSLSIWVSKEAKDRHSF